MLPGDDTAATKTKKGPVRRKKQNEAANSTEQQTLRDGGHGAPSEDQQDKHTGKRH